MFEANAAAIRKEWFSMFVANETGAASVIVWLPPDLHKALTASLCIAEPAEVHHPLHLLPLWW